MIFFPNGKINIGLWIVSRRNDGFHNIETVFYPVGARDACEFVVQDNGYDSDEFTETGFISRCQMSDNLVVKAVNLLRTSYNLPALKIHLHKAIPIGAGLGGGSANGSFMLKYLNRYFRLGLCNNDLGKLAEQLGSDCPFFIENIPAHATGRGEILTRVEQALKGKYILIINPGIHLDTSLAYRNSEPMPRSGSLKELYKAPLAEWKELITNDFEKFIFEQYPQIETLKQELYSQGAIYSSMSGSGSSVFGIFEKEPSSENKNNYWSWKGIL